MIPSTSRAAPPGASSKTLASSAFLMEPDEASMVEVDEGHTDELDAEEWTARILNHLRQTALTATSFWPQIRRAHPRAEPFVFSVSPSAFVLDVSTKTFEARAEALIRVPAFRIVTQTHDMAPLTLPVSVRGRYGADGIEAEMTLLATGR